MAEETKKIEIPSMIVHIKVTQLARTIDPDIRMSVEFLSELNELLAKIINDSIRRCRGNNRKTLKPSDL